MNQQLESKIFSAKELRNVFGKSIYSIFRRFECHHTHYQGTAFRLNFQIFTNITVFTKP